MIWRIEARHYKCLRYVRQDLERFQILVGANASGKSTFLDVLGFLRDLLHDGVEQAVRKRARTLRELVWMQQEASFDLAIEVSLPESLGKNRMSYTRARYEVQIGIDDKGEIQILGENLWIIDETRAADDQATLQKALFPVEQEPVRAVVIPQGRHAPKGWRKVIGRGSEGRVYVRSETTNWNIGLRPPSNKAGLMVVPEEERFLAAIYVRNLLLGGIQTLMLQSTACKLP
ncbi:MAG: hypothetical protein KatS3mg020_0514 [Fimbriimonadales bacterium]|nr:MAG: hypothetical protein KatS3mg020_0514 [Fimbriimonadales bacterium]